MAEMHNTASASWDAWLEVLARLPASIDLDELARTTKAIQRARGISDGSDVLRLGMARGPGGMSLQQTAAWAHMDGVAELSARHCTIDCGSRLRSSRNRPHSCWRPKRPERRGYGRDDACT